MFSENFHTLRKAKGYSQEELAIRLNVVRQTISKWEKGISAPGADMLTRIADIFEVSVNELVEDKIEVEIESNPIADQLSRVNEQLIISNRRSLRMWKTVAIACIAVIAIGFAGIGISIIGYYSNAFDASVTAAVSTDDASIATVITADTDPILTFDASTATVVITDPNSPSNVRRSYDYDVVVTDPQDALNMGNIVISIVDDSGNIKVIDSYRSSFTYELPDVGVITIVAGTAEINK